MFAPASTGHTLKGLAAVLGGLVVLWLVALVAGRPGVSQPSEGGGDMAALLDAIDTAAVRAIVFHPASAETPVRIERAGTGWRVGEHPADSANIAQLLRSLANASTAAPVSLNPANHERMEVDDANARLVVLETVDGADSLLVGKQGQSIRSAYVRLPGRDEVYLIEAELHPHATRSANDWRSKRVAALDTAAVRGIDVSRDGASYRVARADTTWSVDGSPADTTTVRSILAELANLRASAFPPPDSQAAPQGDAGRTITARDAAGAALLTVRLWMSPDTAATTLTASADGSAAIQPAAVFAYPTWQADRLTPERDDVRRSGGG